MATDVGIKDRYLAGLQTSIDTRQNQIQRLKEGLKTAQLEAAAKASLAEADKTALLNAELVGKIDAKAMQDDVDRLQGEVQALKNLMQAARQVG